VFHSGSGRLGTQDVVFRSGSGRPGSQDVLHSGNGRLRGQQVGEEVKMWSSAGCSKVGRNCIPDFQAVLLTSENDAPAYKHYVLAS
jgi:hypothetical protein